MATDLRRTVSVAVVEDLRRGFQFPGPDVVHYLFPVCSGDELLEQLYDVYPRASYKIRVRVYDAR